MWLLQDYMAILVLFSRQCRKWGSVGKGEKISLWPEPSCTVTYLPSCEQASRESSSSFLSLVRNVLYQCILPSKERQLLLDSVPIGRCYYYWSLLYSAILRSQADSLRSHVILHEWIAFYSAFFKISTEVVYLQWLVPQETAAISAHSVYTIQPCTMPLHAKPHT